MDLIYMNPEMVDLGVLQDFEMDLIHIQNNFNRLKGE